jgi:hypothetical protein
LEETNEFLKDATTPSEGLFSLGLRFVGGNQDWDVMKRG